MEYKEEVEQEQEESYVPADAIVIEADVEDLAITLEIIEALS